MMFAQNVFRHAFQDRLIHYLGDSVHNKRPNSISHVRIDHTDAILDILMISEKTCLLVINNAVLHA